MTNARISSLYVNGIAVAVLELKNSRKELSEGIRQNLTNQQPEYIQDFFYHGAILLCR
jgi:type I restriction enzyme R subunit